MMTFATVGNTLLKPGFNDPDLERGIEKASFLRRTF